MVYVRWFLYVFYGASATLATGGEECERDRRIAPTPGTRESVCHDGVWHPVIPIAGRRRRECIDAVAGACGRITAHFRKLCVRRVLAEDAR